MAVSKVAGTAGRALPWPGYRLIATLRELTADAHSGRLPRRRRERCESWPMAHSRQPALHGCRKRDRLCDLEAASTGLDGQANAGSQARQHVNECVGTEEINPPAEKIAHAWLGHAQDLSGLSLFQSARRDQPRTWIIRSARTRRCSASSRRNPKSRNTLPVDGVTLSFIVNPILPRDRRDAAAARKPGIVAARGPHPARASSSRVSRTRAARRWPRRTWRHTQPDVPIPYEPESLGRPAQHWSWVSSPVDPALAEHASVPRPRCAGHPAGRHGCQSSKSRASGEACRTCDNMQVFVYSVKSTLDSAT